VLGHFAAVFTDAGEFGGVVERVAEKFHKSLS
jgi:hypothetical protein